MVRRATLIVNRSSDHWHRWISTYSIQVRPSRQWLRLMLWEVTPFLTSMISYHQKWRLLKQQYTVMIPVFSLILLIVHCLQNLPTLVRMNLKLGRNQKFWNGGILLWEFSGLGLVDHKFLGIVDVLLRHVFLWLAIFGRFIKRVEFGTSCLCTPVWWILSFRIGHAEGSVIWEIWCANGEF